VIRTETPVSLRTCETVPDYPGSGMTQRDVAKWSAQLWYAHADCKSKLESVNKALGLPLERDDEQDESKK